MPATFVEAVTALCKTGYDEDKTLSLSVPASAAVGDLVLAFVHTGNNLYCSADTFPAGWTLVEQNADCGWGYKKIESSGDIASYNWVFLGTVTNSEALVTYVVYRNVKFDDLYDTYAIDDGYNIITSVLNCPSASATEVDNTLVCWGGASRGGASTPPSGMTERYEYNTGCFSYVADKVVTATGAQGTQVIDTTDTPNYWSGISVILNPGLGGGRVSFIGI